MANVKFKKRKRKGRIVIKQRVSLAHKADATRVARKDTVKARKAPTRLAPDAGVNFKIKIRKKNDR